MFKIKILILFVISMLAYGCNSILASHSPSSYPKSNSQLCDVATSRNPDGTVVWSKKLPAYVSEARRRKLNCLSENSGLEVSKINFNILIQDYSDGYICNYAYDYKNQSLKNNFYHTLCR